MLRSCIMSGWEEDFFSADLHDHTKLKEHDASKFSEDCMHRGRALGWVAFMGEKARKCHKGPGSHIRRQLCRGCQGQRDQVHRVGLRRHRSLQLSCVLQKYGRRPCGGMQKGLSRRLRLREKYKKPRDLRPGGRGGQGW